MKILQPGPAGSGPQIALDVAGVREDFPILQREIRPGVPLVYLDSTATAQKPPVVLEAMDRFYRTSNANIHRGVHTLAEEATAGYEAARKAVAAFIGAPSARQVIYTRNTTSRVVAMSFCEPRSCRLQLSS